MDVRGVLQFMGKCSHKVFPRLDLILQLVDVVLQGIGHLVKINGELSQLIAADLPGPVMVIPGSHALGGPGQQTDGPGKQ